MLTCSHAGKPRTRHAYADAHHEQTAVTAIAHINIVWPMTRRSPSLNCCAGCHDLTAREVQVLRLVAAGHTSREIAGELGIGLRTVNTYREHLKEKLGISSVAELTRYVIAHKIDQHA
jgi:DNA-binding CsgD family transcriptional regulator